MSCFKLFQIEIEFKDFYMQKQVTDIFTIHLNEVVVSNKVSYNNRRTDGILQAIKYMLKELYRFLSRHQKHISYGVSQYNKNST